MSKEDYAGSSHTISIEDVYNQLLLTCELEELEDVVSSPTDDDTIYSPFVSRQKYATEYCSFGEGTDAYNGWCDMLKTGTTTYEGAEIYNHYVQVFKSKAWTFNGDKYIDDNGNNQTNVLEQAKKGTCTCFLASFGHDKPKNAQDNSITSKIDMTNYLVIAINGHTMATDSEDYEDDESDDPANIYPKEGDLRAAGTPLATYTANQAGGYMSPTDPNTTNYLIISGKIFCECWKRRCSQRMMKPIDGDLPTYVDDYADNVRYCKEMFTMMPKYWHQTVHLDNNKNGDGAYYSVKFYKAQNPKATPQPVTVHGQEMVYPRMSDWDKEEMGELRYSYSSIGDETDLIKKIPLIQCTLKIGDKYCCETYDENGDATFEWLTIDDPRMPVDTQGGESSKRNHIYIGYNPATDDWNVGAKEYDLANSVLPEYNLDDEGMAIPITAEDNLSGKVEFSIDGVCNLSWDHITRRHPTLFRSTKYYTNLKYMLAHISTIFIKDFKVTIGTDQAGINNIPEGRDLIYMTNEIEDEKYIQKKDDITFKLNTALTTEECQEKLVRQSVKMSNPYIGEEPLRTVYNSVTKLEAKPEELYLSDYYPEYTQPKVLMETEFFDKSDRDWLSLYEFNSLENKEFFITADSYNPKSGHHAYKLKEM